MTTHYERIKRLAARRRLVQEIVVTFRSADWPAPQASVESESAEQPKREDSTAPPRG